MSNPLISRFAGEPAMVEPVQVERFKACLAAVAAHPQANEMLSEESANTADDFWAADDWRAQYRPYVVVDGILQIPVKGVLLHNFPYALGSWATGYDYIWRAFQRGCADFSIGAIKGIALVIDSPGGMVAGCFVAVDKAFALKEKTGVPVRTFAHESAYSAAYAWFSLGDQGTVSQTGGVGSIGVVTSHFDVSKAMEQDGYKITFIHAGKHKVDGNPYEALSPEVKARIQARIDELYEVFVSTVARNRPSLSEEAIRETEALTFTATQALSNGLADSIGSLDDALVAFAADLSQTEGDEDMSTPDKAADTQAAIDAAVTAANTAAASAQATAVADAKNAERARVAGITGCDEAKGREALATHIAMNTDMSVDDAKAMLAAAPAAAAEPAATETLSTDPLASAMASTGGGTGVGADAGNDAEADPVSAQIAADRALAASVGLKGHTAPAGK